MNLKVCRNGKLSRRVSYSAILVMTLIAVGLLSGCSDNKDGQEPPQPPPPVKHKLEKGKECLSCHKEGKENAPIMKHPVQGNCTGCHKPLIQ